MEDNVIKLLYIEENNADIQILRTYIGFNNIPIHIESFFNFKDALEYLKNSSEAVDVILLDFCLSGKDCSEVLKTLKNEEMTKHIPVIVFSNWAENDDKQKCLNNKADLFFVKPRGFDNYSEVIQIIMAYQKNQINLPK